MTTPRAPDAHGRPVHMRQRVAAVFTVSLVLLGCAKEGRFLTTTPDPRHAPAFSEFMKTQQVHVDLSTPPTRERVGMGPVVNAVIIERTATEMLDVNFTLPGGKRLHVPAFGVVFSTDYADPDTAPPRQIIINRRVSDPDAARDALAADAAALGLPAADVDRWYTRAKVPTDGPDNDRLSNPMKIGYLTVVIATSHNSERQVLLTYSLEW